MCATAQRILACLSALSLMWMTLFFAALLGDRVEPYDATVEGLVELEVLMLRTIHVHNVDRVVVRV